MPDLVACDLHPDYGSTRHAEQLAGDWGVPLVRLQHHVAHVLSAVAEWQLAGPVLGLSWDGTGYGLDGTVWGGEAIVVDGPRWTRVGHLRTFPLLGGERVAREPRRAALGLLHEMQSELCLVQGRRWFSGPGTRLAGDRTRSRTRLSPEQQHGAAVRCGGRPVRIEGPCEF